MRHPLIYGLSQWCKHDDEWCLSWPRRVFYTLKALIAYWLPTEPKGSIWENSILVAAYGGGSYAPPGDVTIHWWYELRVGLGVFRNWWAVDLTESN